MVLPIEVMETSSAWRISEAVSESKGWNNTAVLQEHTDTSTYALRLAVSLNSPATSSWIQLKGGELLNKTVLSGDSGLLLGRRHILLHRVHLD